MVWFKNNWVLLTNSRPELIADDGQGMCDTQLTASLLAATARGSKTPAIPARKAPSY